MAYLSPTYDDKSFIDEVLEADRRENNTNDLLNSLDKENAELEKIDWWALWDWILQMLSKKLTFTWRGRQMNWVGINR